MSIQSHRLVINHIRIGFGEIVVDANFADSHRSLNPFGLKWGRGILIRGDTYLDAVTGPYGSTHSGLKEDLAEGETLEGAFYFGFEGATHTLYLEYASVRTFDFLDDGVLDAIIASLRSGSGPFRDCSFIKLG